MIYYTFKSETFFLNETLMLKNDLSVTELKNVESSCKSCISNHKH